MNRIQIGKEPKQKSRHKQKKSSFEAIYSKVVRKGGKTTQTFIQEGLRWRTYTQTGAFNAGFEGFDTRANKKVISEAE